MCVYHVMCTCPLEAAGATGNDTTLTPFQHSAGILYPCSNTVSEYITPVPTQCQNTLPLFQNSAGILYPCSNTVPEYFSPVPSQCQNTLPESNTVQEYFSPAPTQCENTKYLGQLKLGENPIMWTPLKLFYTMIYKRYLWYKIFQCQRTLIKRC